MPTVINEFETTAAPTPPAAAPQAAQGSGEPVSPDAAAKIDRGLRVQHERQRRLAAY